MVYKTWAQIKTAVEEQSDLQDEDFIQPTELMEYANEAIDYCESEILTIYEDYFLTKASLALVSGTSDYNLPSDCYAAKIRSIIYRNGSTVFPIKRIKDWNKFETIAFEQTYPAINFYKYIITNPDTDGYVLTLYPAAQETSASNVTIWYIRNANRLTDDDSICDIPEFYSYIKQYIRVKCYEKEGHPNYESALGVLEAMKKQMVDTLSEMIPDGDNELPKDFSVYNDMN